MLGNRFHPNATIRNTLMLGDPKVRDSTYPRATYEAQEKRISPIDHNRTNLTLLPVIVNMNQPNASEQIDPY